MGNTSHKCYKWNVKLSTWVEHWCRESILPISEGVPRVPIWRMENSSCRCLNFLLIYRRRNGCNCLKHNCHYGMTRSDFINRFKNNINIDGKNQVASADATLVDLFINSHIVNNTLFMIWFTCILICTVEPLSMRRINTLSNRIHS